MPALARGAVLTLTLVRYGTVVDASSTYLLGQDLTPFRAIAESINADGGELVEQVSALIDQTQAFAAAQANATLTLRN